jgi:IclR family transcriptional regulator, pca regulon regulatory protein
MVPAGGQKEAVLEGSPRRENRSSSTYRVEALAKGLSVLTAFSEARPVLTLSELADLTGLPLPTTFRMAATLEEAGYLERLSTGAYRPGLRVLTLGHATLQGSDLVQVSESSLRALADRTRQTVNLAVLAGDQVLYLVRLRNADLVTANIHVGSTLPAVYSSLGKVLLAFLDAHDLHSRLGESPFSRHGGPKAVTNSRQLARQLAQVRAQGFAVQDEEVALGLRAVAAPIRNDANKVVAAINIAVMAGEFSVNDMLDKFKDPLLSTAEEISRRLGMR